MTSAGAARSEEDLLRASAPLAWRIAPALCRPGDGSRPSCAWYHGLWQYLRLLGLAGPPQRHAAFYGDALRRILSAAADPRIVVTACADYGMLAQVLACVEAPLAPGKLAVVDACDTPLFLCKWYAEQLRQPLVTQAADILRWIPPEPYDVACTHSLIPQFAPERRGELIAAWRRILRPGGRVVTTARINPAWTPERAGFGAEQVREYCALVVERARALDPGLHIAVGTLARAAETYAQRVVTHSITSPDELVALFESGGFRMERLELRALAGGVCARLAGPTTVKSGTYAELVAVRT